MTTPSGSTCLYRSTNWRGDRVQRWRHRLGSREYRPCVVDDSGSRVLLLRSPEAKERTFTHLPLSRGHWSCVIPGV